MCTRILYTFLVTFTKLHVSVHEYGGKMKFGAKSKE